MNTDQSLLEFSVFYPEVGFSKSEPLFLAHFWHGETQENDYAGQPQIQRWKMIKDFNIDTPAACCCCNWFVLDGENRSESLCSSITPLTWFFPWFSFLFYHIESWISSLSSTECLCVLWAVCSMYLFFFYFLFIDTLLLLYIGFTIKYALCRSESLGFF